VSLIPDLLVERVRAGYGDLQVLWDLSFEVRQGTLVTLIGSNGAGKTTILKTIAGLLRPRQGSITFGKLNIARAAIEKIVESGVNYVPEGRGIFPDMTVQENLEMGSFVSHARKKHRENLAKAYSLFPILMSRRSQNAGTLSGGEAQMLAIARGLMSSPNLLMLDEPSAGISPIVAATIFGAIEKLRAEGMTILVVEQDAARALKMSDYAYVLENGRISLQGSGEELLNNTAVKQAYLGM
jgi:branched-chain amino acid transport system ATP-binding protein